MNVPISNEKPNFGGIVDVFMTCRNTCKFFSERYVSIGNNIVAKAFEDDKKAIELTITSTVYGSRLNSPVSKLNSAILVNISCPGVESTTEERTSPLDTLTGSPGKVQAIAKPCLASMVVVQDFIL